MLIGSRTPATFAVACCTLLCCLSIYFFLGSSNTSYANPLKSAFDPICPQPTQVVQPTQDAQPTEKEQRKVNTYDLTTPPSTGCEAVVSKLQLRLIEAYSQMLMGIHHVNLWGVLPTENKGDAAIWTGQQILLANLGITTHRSCRFIDRCDTDQYNASLIKYAPYSAIMMAGGGNFNDYYWEDHPARLYMVEKFPNVPIRAFPQSVFMGWNERIAATQKSFGSHNDLMLAARDLQSYRWLHENLEETIGVPSVLVPDIAFAWGNRPDFRLNTPKAYDILILTRSDAESSAGHNDIPAGFGHLTLPNGHKVTYMKLDWTNIHTPGIDDTLPWYLEHTPLEDGGAALQTAPKVLEAQETRLQRYKTNHPPPPEAHHDPLPPPDADAPPQGEPLPRAPITPPTPYESSLLFSNPTFGTPEQRARAAERMYTEYPARGEDDDSARMWAKARQGFEILGAARFVITDRLHGHIMSTVIGTPHVLLDSWLGKNLNFHRTWTEGCDCVRVAEGMEDALAVAGRWFESNPA